MSVELRDFSLRRHSQITESKSAPSWPGLSRLVPTSRVVKPKQLHRLSSAFLKRLRFHGESGARTRWTSLGVSRHAHTATPACRAASDNRSR
jgi:hypothetical protein